MDLLVPSLPTPVFEIANEITSVAGVRLFIKRDDLIHPTVSGNKWRKLKYNLEDAKEQGSTTILTFGGAFSNHLYAVAAAGRHLGLHTIGIVRGEDHKLNETPTLLFCKEQGMSIHYVSRAEYKLRNDAAYLGETYARFENPYIIPEGGTTGLALKGVAEMVAETEDQLGFSPDYYAVPAGTGGTSAGLLSAKANVLAFSSLKGGVFLKDDIGRLLIGYEKPGRLSLFTDYHFGGYAKWNTELLDFINKFKRDHQIQLEQVYTGKMFYGLFDLIKKGYFSKGNTIMAVHTGGMQGLLPELR